MRIPTQESVESGNSANQYAYNNMNQNVYTNLCPQIPPNINRNTPNSGTNIVFNDEYYQFFKIIFLK